MLRLLAGCIALACCVPVVGQTLDAKVEQIGSSEFRIHITFPGVVSPDQAQAMLADAGANLCGGHAPTWGHYKFETNEPMGGAKDTPASTRFEQDLACGSALAVAKPGASAPTTPATDAERRDVEALTIDYLTKKDHGDFAAADAMYIDDVIAQFEPTWRDGRKAFNSAAGLPKARTVVGVTFYDDPADAPRLGRYAAVDFRASYADRAFYCGYVVWLRQADGVYRLVREDETIAPDAVVRQLAEEQRAALTQQPGCRDSIATE